MKVKVAFIHNTIAPYRHPLFEKLSQTTDLIVYYCSLKHSSRKWDLWPRKYDYKYKILPRIPFKTPFSDYSLNPSIVKEIIENKPHVIIIGGYVDPTMWFALAMAIILEIPIIYWTEGVKEPKSFFGTVTRPLRLLFSRKSKAIIVPGRRSKNYVISLGINEEKVFIAPNVIDNKFYIDLSQKYRLHKEKLKAQLGFKDKVIILYVGQLTKRKGVEYLLQAYTRLEQEYNGVALILLGSGVLEPYLKSLANSLRLQNFIIKRSGLNLIELIKLYSAADVFVLPTLEDIWGFVINEAMACGLPVISTYASQAAVEMIRFGENGYIVKEADSNQLFSVLKNLVKDPRLRKRMGEKSRELIMHDFDLSLMVEGFLSAIKCCIKDMRI